MQLQTLKVKKVTENLSTKVCDLTVHDVQHYITSNGVINHNTGAEYGASIIMLVNKAKLKVNNEQVGIIVNAKFDKNRFCKPVPVKFHIDYNKGLNPYVGLDEFYSWDRCGIGRGKFITEKEYDKLSESEKEKAHRVENEEGVKYFLESETGRKICCDNGEEFSLGDLFTKKVFTEERLKRLDEYIQPMFKYADGVKVDDIFDEAENVDNSIESQISNQLLED